MLGRFGPLILPHMPVGTPLPPKVSKTLGDVMGHMGDVMGLPRTTSW
jgi:hypothetical protein